LEPFDPVIPLGVQELERIVQSSEVGFVLETSTICIDRHCITSTSLDLHAI